MNPEITAQRRLPPPNSISPALSQAPSQALFSPSSILLSEDIVFKHPPSRDSMTESKVHESRSEIHDRGAEGFSVYAKGMDASMVEKVKILPFVKPGRIIEMGCGNGAVLDLISQAYPESAITGIDLSDTMLDMATRRAYQGRVGFIKANVKDIAFTENSIDTIAFCSTLHEVYSYSGYDRKALDTALEHAYSALTPGGRIIIRDGVKPCNDIVFLEFKNPETKKKFLRFAKEFGPYTVPYTIHTIQPHQTIQANLGMPQGEMARLRREDAYEFLSKYIYDKNWNIEVKEQFGVYTAAEYSKKLEDIGFRIVHQESYINQWLVDNHYSKDAALFKKTKSGLIPLPYPDTTLVLVGEKISPSATLSTLSKWSKLPNSSTLPNAVDTKYTEGRP